MNVDKKISKLVIDGVSNLHVIADFDRTLTKFSVNGNKLITSFDKLAEFLDSDYKKKDVELYEKYYPIEVSPEMSDEEKIPYMEAWWKEHFQLVADSGLTLDVLNSIVKSNAPIFREGITDFFKYLSENNIPLLIFSAGLGDIIKRVLEVEGFLTPNVHIISNFYDFDSGGNITGFSKNLIHVLNKDESELMKHPYAEKVLDRKNVLLLGDSLGDAVMADSLKHDCVLKMGFLNDKIEERRDVYAKAFDIILEGDGSMQPVSDILNQISI